MQHCPLYKYLRGKPECDLTRQVDDGEEGRRQENNAVHACVSHDGGRCRALNRQARNLPTVPLETVLGGHNRWESARSEELEELEKIDELERL
ncbi:unnamed protein product [Ectocarpus fasciculatus]